MAEQNRKAWSFTAGRPARGNRCSTLVRVFERPDKPGRLFMSCAWRKGPSGAPRQEQLPANWTREQAERQAEITSGERARVLLEGVPEGGSAVSLEQLLDAYHGSRKAGTWSVGHRREQDRLRDFWLEHFGEDRPARGITPDEIEAAAQDKADEAGWGVTLHRKALKYLKAAGRYGRRKAGLFPELHLDPWAAVDFPTERESPAEPEVEPEDLVYSDAEVSLLCTPRPRAKVRDESARYGWRWEGVDWRVTLACNIAADTGRRIGSIRFLRTAHVTVQPGRMWLTFAGKSDKGRSRGRVPVTDTTAELVLAALERQEVQAEGWLLPGGHEDTTHSAHTPWGGFDVTGSGKPIEKLHKAEDLLSIPRVLGRGYHGVKKAHVSVSYELAGGDESKVQDLTGNSSVGVLRKHYRRPSREGTEQHQDNIRARFSEGGHTEAIPAISGNA